MKTSSSQGPSDLPNRSLLTPMEVAEYFKVSRQTVYRWIDSGDMIAAKRFRTIRVPRSEVIRFFGLSTQK